MQNAIFIEQVGNLLLLLLLQEIENNSSTFRNYLDLGKYLNTYLYELQAPGFRAYVTD